MLPKMQQQLFSEQNSSSRSSYDTQYNALGMIKQSNLSPSSSLVNNPSTFAISKPTLTEAPSAFNEEEFSITV